MGEPNHQSRKRGTSDKRGFFTKGHPTIEELVEEQGTEPLVDVSMLRGDFWPEDEPIEEFLTALYEWRGRKKFDPAA